MTVRHAMVGQLRNPPVGCEAVIRGHFHLQKDAILKQCCDWLRGCEDIEEERKLKHEVQELRKELKKLTEEEVATAEDIEKKKNDV